MSLEYGTIPGPHAATPNASAQGSVSTSLRLRGVRVLGAALRLAEKALLRIQRHLHVYDGTEHTP